MISTKDQRKLLNHCLINEVPVFVLTGTDACAMAGLKAYAEEAKRLRCKTEFVEDLETNILPDFRDFQSDEPDQIRLPD